MLVKYEESENEEKNFIYHLIEFFWSGSALADKLNGKDIKLLLSGNSIQGEHTKKGFSFKHFYKEDGTAVSINDRDNEKRQRTWTVSEEGEFCYKKNEGGGFCATIYRDAVTHKVFKNNSKHIWTFTVLPGNAFNL